MLGVPGIKNLNPEIVNVVLLLPSVICGADIKAVSVAPALTD